MLTHASAHIHNTSATDFLYRTQHEMGLLSLVASLVPAVMAFCMAGGVPVAAAMMVSCVVYTHHSLTCHSFQRDAAAPCSARDSLASLLFAQCAGQPLPPP